MTHQPDQPVDPSQPPAPPANPYAGTPNPYGTPSAPPVSTEAAWSQAPAGGALGPSVVLAGWGTRVAASLIDLLPGLVGLVLYGVGLALLFSGMPSRQLDPATGVYTTTGETNGSLVGAGVLLIILGFVAWLGVFLWNRVFKMGRTGQSIGKKAMKIALLDERTGQPMGAGMCFVREIAHYLDGIAYIGYLWPLWDDKKQTFADKILNTVVVRVQ